MPHEQESFFIPPIRRVTPPPAHGWVPSCTKTPPQLWSFMGRTHKLPSLSRRRSGAMWQMTDNLQSGLRCSLWLGLAFFSHSIREFQDVLLKVQPWVGRMSSPWGSSAFDGGDHDNRLFTVSVSLHRVKKKLICLFFNTVCIVFIYICFVRCALEQVLCIQTGCQGTGKTVSPSQLDAF